MRDYELLRRELPGDNEVAESLQHAQVALQKSHGEEVGMNFGGEVEDIANLNKFKAAVSSPGEFSVFIFSWCCLSYYQLHPVILYQPCLNENLEFQAFQYFISKWNQMNNVKKYPHS